MTQYYFHFWDGRQLMLDSEGVDLPDMAAVSARALLTARDLLSEEVKNGRLPLYMYINVEDEGGLLVHTLNFSEAVEIFAGRA